MPSLPDLPSVPLDLTESGNVSPNAFKSDANTNWKEIEEYATKLRDAIEDLCNQVSADQTTLVQSIVNTYLIALEKLYTIPLTLSDGNSIVLEAPGITLTRTGNTYTIGSLASVLRKIVVVKSSSTNEVEDVFTITDNLSGNIILEFDQEITEDKYVLIK